MEWTVHNNTTPWCLLTLDQQRAFYPFENQKITVGTDGLVYDDTTVDKPKGVHYTTETLIKVWYPKTGYWNNYDTTIWGLGGVAPDKVLRVENVFVKAAPRPKAREFFIVMDHGKLIGYFDDYPIALQHYEIIKVKEQL